MKKIYSAIVFMFAVSSLWAAETKIFFDRFEFPLVRTTWHKIEPHTDAWNLEWKLPASGVRWRIRYSGDKAAFKTLTVFNSQGKQIFHDGSCKKATWINLTGSDTYTLKASGNAHSKVAYFAFDTYDNEDKKLPAWRSTLMPSWRFLRVKYAPAPNGGVLLTPAGQIPAIYTLLSNLNQKYRAEFTVTSAEPQTVKILVSWKNKGRKGRTRLNQTLAATPGKASTVSIEFAPTTTPVEITLHIEKELTVNSFNLFQIK